MLFQTLSKDFDLFQASYNLNQKEMSITELMKELQAFENIFKGSGFKAEANVAEPGSPPPNSKRKKVTGKNKGNKLRRRHLLLRSLPRLRSGRWILRRLSAFSVEKKKTLQEGLQRLPDFAEAKR